MKKILIGSGVGLLLVLLVAQLTVLIKIQNQTAGFNSKRDNAVGSYATRNLLNFMSPNSTTTAVSGLPVLVLARDRNRQTARIQNDSATPIYITEQNFDSPMAASTTANLNGGRLNASGGTLEYEDNLWQGDVWASSTLTGLKILFASSTLVN